MLAGLAYQILSTRIRHDELRAGLLAVIFWLALYLFERSWNRTLGLSGTLMIYLGIPTILIDRLLVLRDRARGPVQAPEPVAIGADLVRADDPRR
jgi:hypothetical protein